MSLICHLSEAAVLLLKPAWQELTGILKICLQGLLTINNIALKTASHKKDIDG